MRSPALVFLVLLVAPGCGSDPPPAAVPVTVAPRCAAFALAGATTTEPSVAFQGSFDVLGQDGYPVFRIPSIATTASGVLVAFAEARQSLDDPGAGHIVLVAKRSVDCGRTWSALQVLAANGEGDAHNPAAVTVPRKDGTSRVWLFYNQRPASKGGEFDLPAGLGADSARIWSRWSDDDGVTWSTPRDLTAQVKDPGWAIASMGPGRAIVTRWGRAKVSAGRILVPGWYSQGSQTGSFVFYSDDQGETWQRGGVPAPGTDESQVIELSDGSIVLDARQGDGGDVAHRRIYRSEDGGATWSAPSTGLGMVPVMSSVIRYSAARDGQDKDRLLHSGVSTQGRSDARVWISDDEGQSWTHETVLAPGFGQYTVLTRLDDGSIGMLYESSGSDSIGVSGFNIRFLRFGLGTLGETSAK